MKRLIVVPLLLVAGCGGAQKGHRGPTCAGAEINGQADLDHLRGCRSLEGDLVIRTGATLDFGGLDALEHVSGDIRVGPSSGLSELSFAHLVEVGGTIRLSGNADITGAFFPELRKAASIDAGGNLAMVTLSLPSLTTTGAIAVDHNAALEVILLSSLTHGGPWEVERNPTLAILEVPLLTGVTWPVRFASNPMLSEDIISTIAARANPPDAPPEAPPP